MNVIELLKRMAEDLPRGVALIDTRRGAPRVTDFAELDAATKRVAALFHHHGIGPGDAMLVFCPVSLELYVILLALFRLGAVATFLDPSAGRAHIERCCALCSPKAIICPPKAHLLCFVSPAVRRIPHKFSTTFAFPGTIPLKKSAMLPRYTDIQAVSEETPALFTFTSGTTGQPKMVVRSHGFLLAQHRVLQDTMGMHVGDVNLCTLPIVVLTNLAAGAATVIPQMDLRRPGVINAEALLAQIANHKPTSATAAPAFLEALADTCIETGRPLSGLAKVFCGGAPVYPSLLRRLRVAAPAAEIVAIYGSTEAEPIAEISYSDIGAEDFSRMSGGRGLLAGQPVKGIDLRIMRDQWGTPVGPYTLRTFESAILPAGEPGEIVVSGDHVIKGYVNGHSDRESKFTVGRTTWHRTGDAGYLDPSGRLWLLGRCEAVHSDSRGKLYPFAVESSAQLVPGIRRAALISDRGRRTLVMELASATRHISGAEVRRRLSWAHIDSVKLCRRIPVDGRHNSKIDYAALRRHLDSLETAE